MLMIIQILSLTEYFISFYTIVDCKISEVIVASYHVIAVLQQD